MDYEFLRDATGQVIVKFSMGHEAIGHWLNDEVKGDMALLADVERRLLSFPAPWRSGSTSAMNIPCLLTLKRSWCAPTAYR
ncbi:hypothetical protein SODG_007227 [Sodalis praecaptivus]|nr:hypothetical protein NVIRENTERO_03777 [Sodalis praecaptivus]